MYKAKKHYQSPTEANRYDRQRFSSLFGKMAHRGEEKALRLMLRKHFQHPGSVLDLPCGTGRMFPALLEFGLSVTGADISEAMLEKTQEKIDGASSFATLRADAEDLPFDDNTFDYLVSFRFFCHLPPPVRLEVLTEMCRVTKQTLAINYHFESNAPLALFNRNFRPHSYPAFPARMEEVLSSAKALHLRIGAVQYLSWYERCSAIVIFHKSA